VDSGCAPRSDPRGAAVRTLEGWCVDSRVYSLKDEVLPARIAPSGRGDPILEWSNAPAVAMLPCRRLRKLSPGKLSASGSVFSCQRNGTTVPKLLFSKTSEGCCVCNA